MRSPHRYPNASILSLLPCFEGLKWESICCVLHNREGLYALSRHYVSQLSRGTSSEELDTGGHISVPAKIGKPAPSMAHSLAAMPAVPNQQQRAPQDATPLAEQQHSLQPESSTGTLDCTTPMHGRVQNGAAVVKPWQAFVVEERHVITEPLHASSETSMFRHHLSTELHDNNSNTMSGMDGHQRSSADEHVLDQLQRDSQEDLAAALKSAAANQHAAQSLPASQRSHHIDLHGLESACNAVVASDSAGLDMIPDTVQKQDTSFHYRSERLHEPRSSSKREGLRSQRTFVPDSLDDEDYHLQPSSALKGLQQIR